VHGEYHRLRLARLEIEGLLSQALDESIPRVTRPRVSEREPNVAGEPGRRGVAHLHGDLHRVALAKEPRYERLDHQVFR
jgi:hypothetical protein